MIRMTMSEVAAATGGTLTGDPDLIVDAVGTDSRRLPDGSPLFVALATEQADGHDFVAAALAAGAVAVLAQRSLPSTSVPVVQVPDTWTALADLGVHVRRTVGPTTVAVTGSVGKTTVKDLTAAAIGAGRRVHAARGSYNNDLGVPLTMLGLAPDSEVLVAEVGARHVGDIARLAPLVAPDIAIVTAVAGVHLEVFGSIEAIARAKSELVEALGPDGTAVLHVADPRVAAMARIAPNVISVATDDPAADVHASNVRLDRWARATATAVTPWGTATLTLPVAGRHHVLNALLALAVAGHLGVDLDAAAAAIADAPVSPWRGEVSTVNDVTILNDAYNANPTSVVASLETLVAIERTGRTMAILGVMAEIGETAEDEHLAIGRTCAELGVDHVVVVGEGASGIAAGARAAGAAEVSVVDDGDAAGTVAQAWLAPGDVVVIKGSRVAGLEQVAARLIEQQVTA
jgi:UDP-N-acetylmuramoyl-tripeptide--D-alanyl-D-alanine ligase